MATLSDILRIKAGQPLYSIEQDRSVLDAVHSMNDHSIGALIVTRGGKMTGIITERDILRRVIGELREPSSVRVDESMTSRVVCCTPATTIEEARTLMKNRRVRHLPVIDSEGDVVGLVSIGDLNAHLTDDQEITIHYLHEYLHGRV